MSRANANWGAAIQGNITDLNSARPEYDTLESSYTQSQIGTAECDLGVTSPLFHSFIKVQFQGQQSFNDTQNPKLGFNGIVFNNATLVRSRYCPGSHLSGGGDKIADDYVTETTKKAATALTAYPTVTGEQLFWLNTDDNYLRLYISDDPEFGMGWGGFVGDRESDQLTGHIRLAYALTCRGPRYQSMISRADIT